MTDRLTPAMRIEVLELIWGYRSTPNNTLVQYIAELRAEAAEADAIKIGQELDAVRNELDATAAREKRLRELASAMLAKTSVVLDRPKSPIGEPCVLVEYDAARALWDALSQGGADDQGK